MPYQQSSEGKIVILNGFPGTGKFTILKRVKELLPPNKSCLLDNHLPIDPVQAIYPNRSPEHHELRRKVRRPIFEELSKLAQEGHVVLMTACLADDNNTDANVFQEHLAMVRGTEVPIFWVNVHCDQAVLEQRVGSPERCWSTKTKLTDVDVLRKMVSEHRLIQPCASGDELVRLVIESLDVSGAVETSVARLMNMVGLTQE
ncbi:chloramphenicol phosphotransferase-like protein [Rhizoctonia solani AG-3 Rhs1AP]|uniref:Chloramphenicol phosphotransferase-like protein n=1 Tax=Rhizoctonia solani AG-3 Rhs1AP TaxID=1086054 RepID=X8JJ53_9AGAM|nr:chloramphenicol phosphotransferase-like protein [Rhizoctonia solani AG-3 Rhs1AP]